MTELPHAVTELVDALAAMPGTVAVVLGGSRGQGVVDNASDWDLGLEKEKAGIVDRSSGQAGGLTILSSRRVQYAMAFSEIRWDALEPP